MNLTKSKESSKPRMRILVDGPISGTYSLALVNRKFAVALKRLGFDVFVTQREGPDPTTDPFFLQEPGLSEVYIPYSEILSHRFDVHTKNDWPMAEAPRCAPILTAHCYAWEESLFPLSVITQLNKFDAIFCTSRYTEEALNSSGYTGAIYYMGNGVDHIRDQISNASSIPDPNSIRKSGQLINFLHISSGLPRKGMKAGLRAFVDEFRNHDDVRLTLKTHHNPYNELYELFSSLDTASKSKITLDDSHLSSAGIQKLILGADCCFLPSKGEGFGLPAAEAMLLGTLVCATDAGGNREFCSSDTCVFIPTKYDRSSSIISSGKAAWLEATYEDMRAGLRRAYELCKKGDKNLLQRAYNQVRRYTWERAATHYSEGLRQLNTPKSAVQGQTAGKRIAIISTFNQQCGLATFSQNLVNQLSIDGALDTTVYSEIVPDKKIVGGDDSKIKRIWNRTGLGMDNLLHELRENEANTFFIIQHHPGIISWKDATYLCSKLLDFASGIIVEIHSTDGQFEQISRFVSTLNGKAHLIVHNDLDYIKLVEGLSCAKSLYLFPHPCPATSKRAVTTEESYNIFTFGLCGRHKKFEHLYHVVEELKGRGCAVNLTVLTSVDPKNSESISYSHFLYKLRDEMGLRKEIVLNFDFLPIEQIEENARSSTVAVFCYADVNEGASGAVRIPLSCGVPTVTSFSPIFADLSGICTRVDTSDKVSTANIIQELILNPKKTARLIEAQNDYISFSSWRQHASRLTKIINHKVARVGLLEV